MMNSQGNPIGIEFRLRYETARQIILGRDDVTHTESGPRQPNGTLDIPMDAPPSERSGLHVRIVCGALWARPTAYVSGNNEFGETYWHETTSVLFGGGSLSSDSLISMALRTLASRMATCVHYGGGILYDIGTL